MFTEFNAISKIIRKFISTKALIKKVIIKINFKGDKGAGLNYKLAKKFQNFLHTLILLILTLAEFFKSLLKFLLSIYTLSC